VLGRRNIVLSQSDELNFHGNENQSTLRSVRSQAAFPMTEAPVPAAQAQWWVYVLRCRDGTLYTGVTTDLARRLAQHNAGTASKYTRARRPVVVVYREPVTNHGAALRREIAIKKLPRTAKDQLIATQRRRKRA
jgi:putative endonuclease